MVTVQESKSELESFKNLYELIEFVENLNKKRE